MRRERGGGFVHDQHANIERQRLRDLHGLLLRQGQTARGLHHVHVDVEAPQHLLCFLAHPAAIHDAPTVSVADEDVLSHRQVGEDHRLLVDRCDRIGLGIEGTADVDGSAFDPYLADVRLHHAGHDLDQRGLARTVLAQECVDLSRYQLE